MFPPASIDVYFIKAALDLQNIRHHLVTQHTLCWTKPWPENMILEDPTISACVEWEQRISSTSKHIFEQDMCRIKKIVFLNIFRDRNMVSPEQLSALLL